MFQNINENTIDGHNYKEEKKKIELFTNVFAIKNIPIYTITLMLSMVGLTGEISPFSISILGACISNSVPLLGIVACAIIGNLIKFGISGALSFILTTLVLIVTMFLIKPKYNEDDVNEKVNLAKNIFISTMIIQLAKVGISGFTLYDVLSIICFSIITIVFYKIFVNSIIVFRNFGEKKAFSIEEVLGASLMLAIAVCAFGKLSIFGFSIKNILSILIVLILGWKNGVLVGTTSGVTIGVTLGVITSSEPVMVAAYAISGMISGILNKFGKIGVIIGFCLGNIVLAYVANGNTVEVIKFQEILIAALGLLAIPKSYKIEISDLVGNTKMLPETTTRTLEENKETINKLTNMSNTISAMAREYENAAATIVTDEELEKQEKANQELFEDELYNNLEGKEENLLYEDIYNNNENILDEIFEQLMAREVITRKDIVKIFASHNNYIMGFSADSKEDDYVAQNDIDEIVRAINSAYRVSKLNFIWKKKLDENKKTMSSQLNGVSEALSNLANQITKDEDDIYKTQKEQVKKLLEEKEIELKDITVKQEDSGRYIITLYTGVCDSVDGKECGVKKIARILAKVFNEKMVLQKQKCGLRANDNTCMYTFTSEDEFTMQVGLAKAKKFDSIISGDTTLQTRLEDGKYLLAISDGMGSGPDARKSSKIAIKTLERLLQSGFNNDTALKLVNTTISANTDEDMYATLDVSILDLYKGNMKFIKNGACPTFVKRGGNVETLKSVSLPTGILNNIDLVEYNYDLQDGDIVVMCSDGILESNKEYISKDLWMQEILEEIETDDAQRMADLILKEAIDNDFGKEKDDMTVMVYKIHKKNI